ncbi:MAG: hypothetical protein LBR95_09895 [Azoarcus sp.]|jgi:hypothetical protein|nr:hypothetical protein [Azoarcus sp.]
MKATFIAVLALACANEPVTAQDEALRDPTRPFGWQETPSEIRREEENLRLELVWRKGKKRIAAINGIPLSVGEEIEGFRLIKIGDGEVTIGNGQKRQILRLTPTVELSRQAGDKKATN